MTHKSALYFRDAFREARLKVLANAEHYQELLFVLERLGKHLTGKGVGLGGSELAILGLVAKHGTLQGQPADNLPTQMETGELGVVELYDLVRRARNDAMHEGAFVRNLAVHLVQLSIILEDALVNKAHCKTVKHYMMRHPICAQPWEPVGFIRQTMLEHSFSFLPVQINEKWKIVSDRAVSAYLWQQSTCVGGKKKLERPLQEAIEKGALKTQCAITTMPDTCVHTVLKEYPAVIDQGHPVLVKSDNDETLLGIITAFDLLYAPS